MRFIVFGLLFSAWFAGVQTSRMLGGTLHVLLGLATVMVLSRTVQGKHPFEA